MRFQYSIRDLLVFVFQVALVMSLIATVRRLGIVRYNSIPVPAGGFGSGPCWLLYEVPLEHYQLPAILVASGFAICVACLMVSSRRFFLLRLWVGWLAIAWSVAFFLIARAIRPDIVY